MQCSKHGIEKTYYQSRQKWICPRCESEAVTRRRRKIRQILIEEAGGACTQCGYDRCQDALVFHHLDRALKERPLSNWPFGLDRARKEAAKCALVCANCHAEIHAS